MTCDRCEYDDEDVIRLRLALGRLARMQRQLSPIGLTPSQQSALAMIDRHGPLAVGELARLEQVAPPTISRIVAKLEERSLVRRTVDDTDRRIARVEMTEDGHHHLAEARQRRNRWLAERLDRLPAADAAAILRAVEPLERLADAAPDQDEHPC